MQSQQQYHTFTLTTEPENASPSGSNNIPTYFQNPIAGQLRGQVDNPTEQAQQIDFFRDTTPQQQKVTFHTKNMMDEDNLQQANIPGGKTANEVEKTTKTLEIPYSQAEAAYSLRLQRQCQSEGANEVGQDFIYEDKEESVVLGSEGPALALAESASSQLNDQRQAFSTPWSGQSSELKISPEQLQQQYSQFQQQQQNSQKSIQLSTQMQMISQSPSQSPLHVQAMAASQTSQRRVSLASQQTSQQQISQLSQQKSLPILISPQLSPEASLGGVSQKYDNYPKRNSDGSMRGIEVEQQKQMQADNLLRRQYLTPGQQEYQQQQAWGEEQKNNFTSEEVGEALEELKTGQVQSGLDKFEAYLHKGFRTLNAETFGKVFSRIVKRLNNLSVDFLYKGDIQSAILLLTKCDQWTQTPGFGYFPDLRALILNHFGCTFRRQEQFKKAVSCCEQALQILQNSNERNYRGLTYLNLSALSSQQGEHKKGLDLARIALLESQHEFMEELKIRKNKSPGENEYDDEEDLDYQNKIHTLVISYHNIAAEEEYFGNYEEALLHYEYSLGAAEEHLGQNSRISEHFREKFTKFTQRYAHYKIEGRPIGISDALIVHSDQFQVTAKTKKKNQTGNKRRNLKKNGERSFSAKVISPYQEPKQLRIQQKQLIQQQQQQPQSEEPPNASDPQYDFTGFPNKKPEETQARVFSAGTKRSNSSHKRPLSSSQRPVSAVFSGQSMNQYRIEADQQRNKFETQRIGSPKKLVFAQGEPELQPIQENRLSQHAPPAEGQEMRLVRIVKRKSSKKKIKQTKNLSLRGYPQQSADQQDQNNILAQQSMFNNKSIDFASLFPSKTHLSSSTQAKYQQIQTSQPGAYFQQFQGVSAFKGGPNYGGSQIAEGQTSSSNTNNGKSFDRTGNSNLLFFNSSIGEKQPNNMSKNLTFQYQQQPSFSGPSNLRPQTPSIANQSPQEIVFFNQESDLKRFEKQQQQQSQPSSNSKKGISRIELLESLQKQYQQASNNLQSLESKIQEEIAKNPSKNNKDRFDTEQNYENEPSSNSPSKRASLKPTHKKSSSYSSIKNMFSAGNSSNKAGRQNSLSSLAAVEREKKLLYLPESQFQIRSAKGSISSSSNTSLTTTTKKNNNNRRNFTSNGTLLASALQPSQAAPLSATNLLSLQKQPEPIAVSNFSAPGSSFNLQYKNSLPDTRKYPEKQILAAGVNPNTPSTQCSWQTTPLNSGQFQNLANSQIQQQYQYQPPLNAWRVYQNQGWMQFPMNQNFLGASTTDNKSTINSQETLVNILRTQLSCLNPQQDKLVFEGNLRFVLNRTKLQLQIAFTSEQFVGQLEHCINVSDLFISHQTDDFAMVGLLVAFSGEILKSLFVNTSQNCLSIFFTDSKNSSNIGDGQILLDKVLLKLDVKHLSMKQDVEIVIKNSNESILLLCEESAPLQDSHTNDDGNNEGEDNIKPLVNTDMLNLHLNREHSNKTEQSSTDSINPLVIDAGSTAQQERNFRRNNLTSVRGKRSVGEEMILEVIEETDTFSQLKNNHMNVTNTQSLSNLGNTLPNNRSSFMNNNNNNNYNSGKNSEVVNYKMEGESTGKGSNRNKEKRENNQYQDDIFEEIQDLDDDAGEDDNFEQNVKLAVAEGELKQNNSRPKSSYERRGLPTKKKQGAKKETDLPQGQQDKLPKGGQAKISKEESQEKRNKQENIIQEIEDNSTPTSKYGFQTRDFMKRKPQPSNSKLLLEIESAFELPHDDVRFDNDKRQLSNFGGFEEEPGFSNSKREHTFDDSPNQSLQEIVAETMEGQKSKQGINLRPRTTSSPTVAVEGQQRQRDKKGTATTPTNRADYNKSEQFPLKEEDQNVRRATPPPKIVINNGFDNEDPYLAYDNKQQEEANNLRQQEDEKANLEFQKLLEESDPERLNFTAALIQRRFRNKKMAKEQEEQKGKEEISAKDDKQKKTEAQVVKKEEKKENAEIVVLDGPIEEYEKVASLIGNAFRNRKRKEKEQKAEKGAGIAAGVGVGSTQNNTPLQGNDKKVNLKDQTPKTDANTKGNEPGSSQKKEEEKVVLDGPIEEYEQVANKIGAAYRMKKKRQAEAAEALKKQKELQKQQVDQGQPGQNSTTPFSSSLIANPKQEIVNPNDLSHGSEAVKILTEEQEKLMTGESVLNDTENAQGNVSQEQANIPIVKKKSQVQGKFKLNRRFKQQVDFII